MPHIWKNTPYNPPLGKTMLAWSVIGLSGILLSGCIGPILGQFFGRQSETVKVPAEYNLPPGNLLILVDSPAEITRTSGVKVVLARELLQEIEFHHLAPVVIPLDDLARFSAENMGLQALDMAQTARELQAQQVLRVRVTEFRLGTLVDSPAGQGFIRTRVAVLDVQQNRQVWPSTDPLGLEVIVRTPFREPTGTDYQQDYIEDLCQRAAVKIVKLFRDHEEPRH